MRPDTSFSERKLTKEEFSKKYWLDGLAPYQYHTAGIEDGRDEREQFMFNNIRALYNLFTNEHRRMRQDWLELRSEMTNKIIRQKAILFLLSVILLFLLVLRTATYAVRRLHRW